ncbi:MAG: carbohydrate-binding protein [Pseudomonadota bacterium]
MLRKSLAAILLLASPFAAPVSAEPIQVGFLWHMHQPIYYPYEPLTQSESYFSFSPVGVHNQRLGPYTTWPYNAVAAGTALPHLGAQVSFSGSLIENLNVLEAAGSGGGVWNQWQNGYVAGQGLLTARGNPRLDLVAFGYHHPLMPLLDDEDIRMQIALHRYVYGQTWNGAYPAGMFPPETAFSTRMIPALVAEGIEWALVDNIHFDRASKGYPYTAAAGLVPPNPADQVNPDPADTGGAWVQLTNLWAPSRVSAPFGYQPHYAQHVDPETGAITRLVVVPAARYEGNEDGRGGYGAFLYDQVMDTYLPFNTDDEHPMFVVLHHDGDNFGGGSEAYYHGNFQNMVAWAGADPDYTVTTVADYLERFPVAPDDVIHVEDGSWAGADNGDPEFSKWLGTPDGNGVSPDINSWAVLTAAKNRVFTADNVAPFTSLQAVLDGTGSPTDRAWHYLLVSEASDYWYWDGSPEPWDGNVTRGANLAVAEADAVLVDADDLVPPTVFMPQREPYNPGGYEFGASPEPTDFAVWTLIYDVSGVAGAELHYRVDDDGDNPLSTTINETYAGGPGVGAWVTLPMTAAAVPAPAGVPVATYRAQRYEATVTGLEDVLVDYYVEAVDGEGNVKRSPISHVWVGAAGSSTGDQVSVTPDPVQAGESVTVRYTAGGPLAVADQVYLHYGFDGWSTVVSPDPPMLLDTGSGQWEATVPVPAGSSQLNVVFNDGAGNWDNNGGLDWQFDVEGGAPPAWQMDGVADAGAVLVAKQPGRRVWIGVTGDTLYVATDDAGEQQDVFVVLARDPGGMQPAMWGKAGTVAAWDAFLADENDNGFSGWFDQAGAAVAATGANGGVLEGTLNLVQEFGVMPASIHLAVVRYATADGGALDAGSQVPPSVNGDGNVDREEFLTLCLGDFTQSATGCGLRKRPPAAVRR